ncbi:Gfo/Idh/MocA family oxidoreductase [Phyllobacterium sp. 628]|uniref:Gfo/Idh/MocA family protein n=1 Tax=Phyllobacterium sp. 628 TaxID=2718938 RepID=UPI0016628200|nr:Gfo/Idh/MocA family oxidoreductase [Phyllobacterium sp. 628]QND51908.1 Gfo/Idh/MocA family oxidoreductase [Phyllobacterium sp. 628]
MSETGDKAAKSSVFGWGIVGSGEIAQRFAADLAHVPDAALVANHSRSLTNAEQFRDAFGGRTAYSDYDSFLADPGIDAVYIATPNSVHLAQSLKAVRSGKAILTEKPLAPSHMEAAVIQREAARIKVFAMEGLWVRFLPAVIAAKAKIDAGGIGTIRRITAELSYAHDFETESRLFNRSLGGGATLDLGICCVSLAMHFLGQPQKVSGLWHAAPNGVDMSSDITLHYDEAEAVLSCGFDRDGANHFVIEGAQGALRLDGDFVKAQRITQYRPFLAATPFGPLKRPQGFLGKLLDRLPVPGRHSEDYPFEGSGMQFEAMAVMDAIRNGEKTSKIMPLIDSINVLRAINIVLGQPATTKIIKL